VVNRIYDESSRAQKKRDIKAVSFFKLIILSFTYLAESISLFIAAASFINLKYSAIFPSFIISFANDFIASYFVFNSFITVGFFSVYYTPIQVACQTYFIFEIGFFTPSCLVSSILIEPNSMLAFANSGILFSSSEIQTCKSSSVLKILPV